MAHKARNDTLLISGVSLVMLERSVLEVPEALVEEKFWAVSLNYPNSLWWCLIFKCTTDALRQQARMSTETSWFSFLEKYSLNWVETFVVWSHEQIKFPISSKGRKLPTSWMLFKC